jgi:glycosyltransferase involved in cell wall biosynthesis
MSSKTIGLVICAYKGHIPHLKRLFASIEAQTRKPDMVIVSCSSTEPHEMPYSPESYSFPLSIYTHSEKKNCAQNRNYAASMMTTDIVSFMDADDIMHPQRMEIILDSFIKYDICIFMHNTYDYEKTPFAAQQPVLFSPISSYQFTINRLYRSPTGSAEMNHEIQGASGFVTCGHVSVLRSVLHDILFRETVDYHGRDDTIFASDVIITYPNRNIYCYEKLSAYYPSHTYGHVDRV